MTVWYFPKGLHLLPPAPDISMETRHDFCTTSLGIFIVQRNGPLIDVGPPRSLHLDCAAVMFFVIHYDLDIFECTFNYLFLETSFQVDAFCLELR